MGYMGIMEKTMDTTMAFEGAERQKRTFPVFHLGHYRSNPPQLCFAVASYKDEGLGFRVLVMNKPPPINRM